MIYSPAYQGKHNYSYYETLKSQLHNIDLLNVDFVHLSELEHYFETIFCPAYCDSTVALGLRLDTVITIESKDKKRLNIVRKVLRLYIIEYTETWKAGKHYRLKVKP